MQLKEFLKKEREKLCLQIESAAKQGDLDKCMECLMKMRPIEFLYFTHEGFKNKVGENADFLQFIQSELKSLEDTELKNLVDVNRYGTHYFNDYKEYLHAVAFINMYREVIALYQRYLNKCDSEN